MPNESVEPNELTKIWEEKPDIIRRFLNERPEYEQLCAEIAYILQKRLTGSGIEFAAVTYRAKSLESFIEKIIRKEYKNPFSEITDIAGVRVVYLYASDFPQIEEVVQSEFEIIEKVDKIKNQGADKFGYGAVHFIVRLGKKYSGARYDDLKGLVCEVQIRTVLQDAWAVIDHHLVYKQESAVPNILKRKLNSLSGLFETADDQFDRIRSEREKYVRQIESKLDKTPEFLNQEINLDTVTAFLRWRFPDLQLEGFSGHISKFLGPLNIQRYSSLAKLDELLSRTNKARTLYIKERVKQGFIPSAMSELQIAILYDDPSLRTTLGIGPDDSRKRLFEKYDHLIER